MGDVTLYAKFVEQIDNMLYLTTSQLSAYIGYKGFIYDVTGNPNWPKGEHRGYISVGQDVTLLFASSGAPHGDSNITSLPIVGYLVTN
jgi:predicted heme/steroid binding protein